MTSLSHIHDVVAPWLLERQPQKSLTQLYQSLSTTINNSFQNPHVSS